MADTALQVAPQSSPQVSQIQTFAPRSLGEAIEFAKLISDSGMVPKDYVNKPGAIVVAIQMGMEVGLLPIQALQSIAVINGRPGLWGDGALAIVKAHPDFVSIHEDDPETIKKNNKATCIIKRRNQPDVKATFGQDDAQTAGLWKKAGPWTTAPFRMMQIRARGFAMRDQFPDALKGIKTVEELRDYPGETIEGTVAQPATTEKAEETIGQQGGSEYYKIYIDSGWTPEDSKTFLRDNLQIGPPHNEKNSKDIPLAKKEVAFAWAKSPAPIKKAVEEKFEAIGLNPEERTEFFTAHKGPKRVEEYTNVSKALDEEIERRNKADRGE
jgi:hypothetical protein